MSSLQIILARAAQALAFTLGLMPHRTERHVRRAISAIADAQRDLEGGS